MAKNDGIADCESNIKYKLFFIFWQIFSLVAPILKATESFEVEKIMSKI